MGKNDIVIFGSGPREACIAEAFIDYGYDVGNVTTDANQISVHTEGAYVLGHFYSDAGHALNVARRLNPQVVIIQEEALLFQGVATHLRQQGLEVFGADAAPTILEQSKSAAREIVKKGFPNLLPELLLTATDPSDFDYNVLPEKYIVRSENVEGATNTTVVAYDALSRKKAAALLQKGRVLVEKFMEGRQLTYYVFTDNRAVHVAPPLRTYPFRLDQEKGEKTGGMGCVAAQKVNDQLLESVAETVEAVARHIVSEITQAGDRLHCFSIEVIVGDESVAYVESDVRLGDPEVSLLGGLMERHDLAKLIMSLSSSSNLEIPRYGRTDGLSVVIAPTDYPNVRQETIVDDSWIGRLAAKGGVLHLGRIQRRVDGTVKLSPSRVAVYTRTGPMLSKLRSTVYDDLESAALPAGLSFRSDIGAE